MQKFTLVKVDWLKHRESLKEKIDKIGEEANEKTLYDNINKACSDERAFLFLAFDCFIVLRPRHQEKTNYIEIVVAYCDSGRAINHYKKQVISIAKKTNAKYLEFLTKLKSIERTAKKFNLVKSGNHQGFAVWRYYL